jgi:2-dehydropantoate 2-reductase
MLAEGGSKVVLVARPAHAQAVNKEGLMIRNRNGDRRVTNLEAVTSADRITPQPDDVIMLAVKTSQTAASVAELRDVFDEETPVVCLQNGVRNEELAARRFRHVYGGMAGLSATLNEPGVISQSLDLMLGVGNYPLGTDETARTIVADLLRGGFKATTHERIMAVKWTKLLLNLNNALIAITNVSLQQARSEPAMRRFIADTMEEGLNALAKAEITIDDPNNPYDVRAQIATLRDGEIKPPSGPPLPEHLRTYSSTWSDLKRRRGETESQYFNGEIVLLGEKTGFPTPYNTTLLRVVEEMAALRELPGRYTVEELEEMATKGTRITKETGN